MISPTHKQPQFEKAIIIIIIAITSYTAKHMYEQAPFGHHIG